MVTELERDLEKIDRFVEKIVQKAKLVEKKFKNKEIELKRGFEHKIKMLELRIHSLEIELKDKNELEQQIKTQGKDNDSLKRNTEFESKWNEISKENDTLKRTIKDLEKDIVNLKSLPRVSNNVFKQNDDKTSLSDSKLKEQLELVKKDLQQQTEEGDKLSSSNKTLMEQLKLKNTTITNLQKELDEIKNKSSKPVFEFTGDIDKDTVVLLNKIEDLNKLNQALLTFKPPNVDVDDIGLTLSEIEAKLAQLMVKYQNEENVVEKEKIENLIDKYTTLLNNNPEKKQRDVIERNKWEEEQLEANLKALETMKSIVKQEYLTMTVNEMVKNGLNEKLSKRIRTSMFFKLFYMQKSEISKMHITDLNHLTKNKPDITELRAIYTSLPNFTQIDKHEFRENIYEQLKLLVNKEKMNTLTPSERRNTAYTKNEQRNEANTNVSPSSKQSSAPKNKINPFSGGKPGNNNVLAELLAKRNNANESL